MLKSAAIGITLLSAGSWAQKHDQYSRTLKLNADGSFKIVNFSDLMMNNNSEDYLRTEALIETVLDSETPDLVVLTGDVVDPENHDNDFAYHFSHALELVKARQIPWVWTGGNHQYYRTGYDMHEVDYGYGMDLSWTGYVWDLHTTGLQRDQEKLGYFTSRIPIMDASGKEEVFSVYTLDTSHQFCKRFADLPGTSCISSEAVDWFVDQQNKYSHNHKSRDFVFLHKPIPEFMQLANNWEISGHKQQAISCHALNSGLYAAALDSERTVWINAGFDSNNDFSGRYHNQMMFSYARKSGYGGVGDLDRGVRAMRINVSNRGKMSGYSYVIEAESGLSSTDMHKRAPPTVNFIKQTECSTDQFANVFGALLGPEVPQQ